MEYIISNINLLYGEDLVLTENRAVWIKDGMIKDVLEETLLPEGIPIYDGGKQYLIPGLIDMHIHMIWDGSSDPVSTLEQEGHDQMVIRAVSNCRHYLNNGITTVRDVGSVDDIALQVSQGIQRELILGPDIIASGKTLTITGGHDPFWARFVDGKDEALKGVREQIFKGASVIKVCATSGAYGRAAGEKIENIEMSLEELTVITEEAHRFGLKVASHAINKEGIKNSLLAGIDTIEHGHYMDDELIDLMMKNGSAWIPTLYVYQQLAEMASIPVYAREKAKEITMIHAEAFKKYFKSGVLIGAGSDAGSPETSHHAVREELYLMDELIGDCKAVLKTATVNAAKILGLDTVGKIEPGCKANLVLLKQNPLDNLQYLESIQQVFINGKIVISKLGI